MHAHAIVIGIDGYTQPAWCLTGAVRDAIAFAQWAVTSGGVALEDLTLLLSPQPADPPLAERLKAVNGAPDLSACAKAATRDAILKTFYRYQTGAGKDAERLWLYYGGHGVAPSGQSTTAGPLVVPADVEDLDYYVNAEPVALEVFRGNMEDVAPKEQFYFVDACRDVLPPIGNKALSQQLLWDVRNIDDDKLATQAIFLATTAGRRAKELKGHGLFGRALLAALRGLGPRLSPPAAPTRAGQVAQRRLLFNDMVSFVNDAVSRALKDLPGIQSEARSQPYARVNRLSGDIIVAEFPADSIPTAKLTTIVEPGRARSSARIEFLSWSDDEDRWTTRRANPAPVGPPVPELVTFELRGGSHHLRVTAPGFMEATREVLVYEDKRIPVELEPGAPVPSPGIAPMPRGPLDTSLESTLESLGPAPPPPSGTIVLRARDVLARVSVVDGGGKERGRAYGELRVGNLGAGPYRVIAELTATERVEETLLVRPGAISERTLEIPGPPINPALARQLASREIHVDSNYAYPSENFGAVANVKLGTLLAYAAWSARWPASAGFGRLRSIGVDSMEGLQRTGSALQVLVGDLAEGGSPERVRVRLELARSGREEEIDSTTLELAALAGLPQARQASAVRDPGPLRVRVEMPDYAPASFPMALIPGFVSVLVISREEDGDVDVQQYMNPIDPTAPAADGLSPPLPDDVRLVELAWRALEGRDPLDSVEHKGLLDGKRSNPLLGVIAGYRMFDTPRADEFLVVPEAPPERGLTASPLWNLVRFFPELPDVHVLAGLYDSARRDAHFERAMQAGTPVLAAGFWALVDWLTARAMSSGAAPPTLGHNVLPGTAWTAFTDASPASAIESVHIVPTAGRPSLGDRSNPRVLELAQSVGRVEIEAAAWPFVCGAFLVTPRLAMCPLHGISAFIVEHPDGQWQLRSVVRVRFDLRDPTRDRLVTRVVRVLRPPPDVAIDGGMLNRETLDTCWPVLMELDEPVTPPLRLGDAMPYIGQQVAVIGFPHHDAQIPGEAFARHFAGGAGEKHFMPGRVLRATPEGWTFDYDCYTAAGTSGGAVVDLATGTVIGMHVAATQPERGRRRGLGVTLGRLASDWPRA